MQQRLSFQEIQTKQLCPNIPANHGGYLEPWFWKASLCGPTVASRLHISSLNHRIHSAITTASTSPMTSWMLVKPTATHAELQPEGRCSRMGIPRCTGVALVAAFAFMAAFGVFLWWALRYCPVPPYKWMGRRRSRSKRKATRKRNKGVTGVGEGEEYEMSTLDRRHSV